jgi:plasmid replication initiation protein
MPYTGFPAVLYRSEYRTITARDPRRKTATVMKYMRQTTGYTWTDYKTNTEIAKELNVAPVLEKIQEYRRYWLERVKKMPHNRLPRILKSYRQTGKRKQGRPLKRLLEFETGSGRQVAQMHVDYMMMMTMKKP